MAMPVEVFNSPSALPKDPILRKQHLEDLMAKIHSSFSFMQVKCGKPMNILSTQYKMKLEYLSTFPQFAVNF